jgi:hypothetical protein
MEHAAAESTGFARRTRWARRATVALAVGAGGFSACAQEAALAETAAAHTAQAAAAESPLQLEMSTSALPRLEAGDNGFANPRVDLSLLPANRTAFGPAVGMSGLASPSPTSLAGTGGQRPTLDLGLRMRHTLDNNQQIDVTAWRRMSGEPDTSALADMQQPRYGARVEMNLSKARKGLFAERGFVGFQLEGGARISVKRKNGGPMVYYRTAF